MNDRLTEAEIIERRLGVALTEAHTRLAACEQERDEWKGKADYCRVMFQGEEARADETQARLAAAEEALRLCVDALGELTEPDPQIYDAYDSARAALAANTETSG